MKSKKYAHTRYIFHHIAAEPHPVKFYEIWRTRCKKNHRHNRAYQILSQSVQRLLSSDTKTLRFFIISCIAVTIVYLLVDED